MRYALLIGLLTSVVGATTAPGAWAQSPRNMGVTFNGESDVMAPLPADQWHTIAARYRYPGKIGVLTNTYLVLTRGGDPRTGFYLGYHVPSNELAIVKHGQWNATEATGKPGEAGKIIQNDQGYMDCEHSRVERTADEITVTYRVKFKPGVLQGLCNVLMYIEDKDVNYEGFTAMGTVTVGRDATVHRTDMPGEWTNALRPRGPAAPELLLADRGRARYTLLIPRETGRINRKAATDLAQTLQLICGAEFPLATEGSPEAGGGPFISLGRTELLANSACRWKNTHLGREGYALEVSGPNLYVYGSPGRGVIHGVYALLEEDLGCRWYANQSTDTPRRRKLTVSVVPRRYAPALELRDPYILSMHDAAWSLRNRTNSPHARIPLAWGGSLRYHHMGHTYAQYFPTAKYFATHPEYYSLVNGKRQPTQLCHTNEDVIRLSIEQTCEIFRSHPEVTITAIGPNDGRGFCDCADCRRLDEANGGRSGSYFHFLNRIAAGVKKEFPHHRIISLAYLDYAPPPTQLEVDDYIIIQLCTDSHAWKYQFCYLWESADFQKILKAWQAVKATVFVWDYTTDYVHYLVPMANWPVVTENTRFLLAHGVTGIMYESELNDLDEMRAWVWAKQLWDPSLDTRALMKDFVYGYFKEAAPPLWDFQAMMWSYWEKWHRLPHRCGEPSDNPLLNNLHCSYAPDGPMFTPEFMVRMRDCYGRAEALAQSDEIRARVRKAKLPLLYLELAQNLGYYSEFGDFIYGRSLRQTPAEKQRFQPLLAEFTALCRQHNLTTLGIPITVDRITAKWQACLAAESATLPKVFLPDEWVFRADPADEGVAAKWFSDPQHFAAAATLTAAQARGVPAPALPRGMSRLHINRGVGWEQQGFSGLEGYGWYFQNLDVPPDLAQRKHLYLCFLGVNEQAWVYVNGQPVGERTYASTNKSVGDLIGTPFSLDVRQWLQPGQRNTVALRVTHSSGLGGMWLPAMLIGTEEPHTTEQLAQYRP